jgi:hypothetical protein
MATALNQALGLILKNYADVIEGGSSFRGSGTAYNGIPGTWPNDEGLRTATDSPLVVIGGTTGAPPVAKCSTTTFDVGSGYSWASDRWVKENAPSFWALSTSTGTNKDAARKITGWNNTTKVFTVSPAFTIAPVTGDSMTILQGFKRIPNNVDIESDAVNAKDGFDRTFHLLASCGSRMALFGNSTQTNKTNMILRMRFAKYGREHDAVMCAFENMTTICSILSRGALPDHRDGTYTVGIWLEESPKIIKEDQQKIVISATFVLIYKVSNVFN